LASNKYNTAVINFKNGDKTKIALSLKEVIKNKNSTYSPLALYFLIDNNLIDNRQEINDLFDIIINEISLEEEIKNLIIYKKALYNADYINENLLLEILNPIINSESVWKSHALYLLAEYFYSKNEKQKSKEFFSLILSSDNSNQDLIKEAQKRLNRDLSE
jgi:DNA polymerase III delta prime subunit